MAKRTRTSPKRYALQVIDHAGKVIKRLYFNSLRALREKFHLFISSAPSLHRVVAIRRTDGFAFGHRRGLVSPS